MAVDTLHLAGAPRAAVPQAGPTDKLAAAFAEEEREGRRLAFRGRTIALVAIALLLPIMVPFPRVLYYQALLGVFILLGYLRNWVDDTGRFRRLAGLRLPDARFRPARFHAHHSQSVGLLPSAADDVSLRQLRLFLCDPRRIRLGHRPIQVLWGGAWEPPAGPSAAADRITTRHHLMRR